MILQFLLLFCGFVACCSFLALIVGATVYDIRDVRRTNSIKKLAKSKRYKRRPLVSIIVYSNNSQDTIASCLRSIGSSRYRKLEIIIADANSTDNTKSNAREFIKQYPKKQVRLFAQRAQKNFADSMIAAKKHIHGDIVLTVRATSMFDNTTIMRVVEQFNSDDELDALIIKSNPSVRPRLANLLERYLQLIVQRKYKLLDISKTLFTNNQPESAYSKTRYMAYAKKPEQRINARYAATATINSNGLSSYVNILRMYWNNGYTTVNDNSKFGKVPLVILLAISRITKVAWPVIVVYCSYVAIALGQSTLLIAIILLIAAFVLHAVWNDAQSKLTNKINYTIALPITFGFSFAALSLAAVQSIHQIITQLLHYVPFGKHNFDNTI